MNRHVLILEINAPPQDTRGTHSHSHKMHRVHTASPQDTQGTQSREPPPQDTQGKYTQPPEEYTQPPEEASRATTNVSVQGRAGGPVTQVVMSGGAYLSILYIYILLLFIP